MAIDRKISKKAPSQNPVQFFECVQQGGMHGRPEKVGDRIASGKMREMINGRKGLSKQ